MITITAVIKAKVPFAAIPDAQRSARTTLAATLPSLDTGPVGRGITRFRTPADGALDMEMGSIVAPPGFEHMPLLQSAAVEQGSPGAPATHTPRGGLAQCRPASHCAFSRQRNGETVVAAAPRLVYQLYQGGQKADWGATEISLPPRSGWRDVFTGRIVRGPERIRASDLLADFPVCVLLGAAEANEN